MASTARARILVVGFGSVGRRHARNLFACGAEISVVDVRADRLAAEDLDFPVVSCHSALDEALASGRFHGAVVATPTSFHVEQTLQLAAAGCRILLEKPVAMDHAAAARLRAADADWPILLGYTWRWWPALQAFRQQLNSGRIGKPLRAEFVMASHLADWHPWEPLTDFFMAHAALGGGALLDESHWIDQMLWLFGEPEFIAADVEHVSSLAIDSDDHVELRAFYRDGLRVRIHLDLITRPAERSIKVVGERGVLAWSFESNVVSAYDVATDAWTETPFGGERNDMFAAVAGEFLDVLESRCRPSCTLDDGLAVMAVIEAARESHRRLGARVPLP